MARSVNGQTLRQYREGELDLSPVEAAGLLQISVGYLRNIENGSDSAKLSERLVGRIARGYRLDRRQFVLGKDDEKETDPSHPKKRQEKEKSTGPKRARDQAVA